MQEFERTARREVLEQATGMSRAEAKDREETLQNERKAHLGFHCFDGLWAAELVAVKISEWRRVISVMDAQGMDTYMPAKDPSAAQEVVTSVH
ncbi:hypothetical protein A6A06_18915 [Streptomyces sp. CB02923]|uniref:hypothetical protein n=1 Tax=Streptomyces sp. CB02923 TaxID=1718985 RepID=UPI000938B83B|nr:hypothetical protein [Streptomyces sp. CB02923]OKI00960.1 hypothetical protein A6A06_18915 [Streptomyces sp. CB02923]